MAALFTPRPGNVATPLTAATVAVPDSVPPPGLLPSATVTFPVKLVTVLPRLSCVVTCTDGVIAAPATTLDGCTVKTSLLAAAALMLNAALVGALSPVDPAVSV